MTCVPTGAANGPRLSHVPAVMATPTAAAKACWQRAAAPPARRSLADGRPSGPPWMSSSWRTTRSVQSAFTTSTNTMDRGREAAAASSASVARMSFTTRLWG